VSAIFALNGLVLASWVSRIPEAQKTLGMSPGVLGLALLATSVGSLVAMPVTGWLIARRGSRPLLRWSSVAFCLSLLPLAASGSVWALAGALLLFGAAAGAQNVAMNTHAVSVEEDIGKPIMASFHAAFSMGAMLGAALGGLAAGQHWGLLPHFALASAVLLGITLFTLPGLHQPSHAGSAPKLTFRIPVAVLGLGAIACTESVAEGAMADWSAVYLESTIGVDPGRAAFGFAAYSATMVVGRLLGDKATALLGPVRIVVGGCSIAFLGMTVAVLTTSYPIALAGFAVMGIGLSAVIPNVFGAAGRVKSLPPGVGMAAVTMAGYVGFLNGPPLIGGLAQYFGLRVAMMFVLLCLAIAAWLGRRMPAGD